MTSQFSLADTFKPNKAISEAAFVTIGVFWVCTLCFFWLTMRSALLPSPWEVFRAFPNLWSNEGLGAQLWVSFSLNLEAVAIMTALSLAISYLTALPLVRPVATLIAAGRFNGFVGLPLIFLMILHQAHWVKVALLVYAMTVFTVPAVVELIDEIPKEEFDDARTLRMSEWRVVWEAAILGRFAEIIEVLRINVSMGWMTLPLVEGMFKFEGGVGALMMNEDKHFHMDAVYAVTLTVLFLGLLQDYAIGVFKGISCPYSKLGAERR